MVTDANQVLDLLHRIIGVPSSFHTSSREVFDNKIVSKTPTLESQARQIP